MYSPKISEEFIPLLYRKAKAQKKPMTQLVNEIIRDALDDPVMICSSCKSQVVAEPGDKETYCEKCECVVFAERR